MPIKNVVSGVINATDNEALLMALEDKGFKVRYQGYVYNNNGYFTGFKVGFGGKIIGAEDDLSAPAYYDLVHAVMQCPQLVTSVSVRYQDEFGEVREFAYDGETWTERFWYEEDDDL